MNSDIDKKNLILEKAKDMIITESYSSLSISKLTSELSISKGSFYTYFPSKDKMLGEILDEYIKNIIIFKNNLLENSKNIDDCLDYYINSILSLSDEELKLELVITNLKRNYEVFNEENFKKLEVKKMYRSDDMKEHLEFIKKSIKKIIY